MTKSSSQIFEELVTIIYKNDLQKLDEFIRLYNNLPNLREIINRFDDHGNTPICAATIYGYPRIVKKLLELDEIDINLTSDSKSKPFTALQLALLHEHFEIAKILIDSGKVDFQHQKYGKPAELLLIDKMPDLAKKLISNGSIKVDFMWEDISIKEYAQHHRKTQILALINSLDIASNLITLCLDTKGDAKNELQTHRSDGTLAHKQEHAL